MNSLKALGSSADLPPWWACMYMCLHINFNYVNSLSLLGSIYTGKYNEETSSRPKEDLHGYFR